MKGRRCRWPDRTRRTCASGCWRRWRRAPRPRGRRGGSRAAARPPGAGGPPRGGAGGAGRAAGGGRGAGGRGDESGRGGGGVGFGPFCFFLGGGANHLTLAEF